MAIISNFNNLKPFLKRKKLEIIIEYFQEALNNSSKIHNRIKSLPIGSFEKVILTKDIYALEQVFYTKNREECFIESHKKYIDFQLVISGNEQMEYIDINKLETKRYYNKQKDLITYKLVDNTSKFLLQEKDLAIFFPDDGHIGCPKYNEVEVVYKTVVKFPMEFYLNED